MTRPPHSTVRAFIVLVAFTGCRQATLVAPKQAPPPPYSAVLAARVEELLPACHAGVLPSCEELADALLADGYWREAASSLAYACWLPPEVAFEDRCDHWLIGACEPEACACAGQPDCKHASWCGGPGERELLCGDGSYAACVQRRQVGTCSGASTRLDRWSLTRDNDADVVCSDTRMLVLVEASEFNRRACEDLPVAARERSHRIENIDACDRYEDDLANIRDCEDFRNDMARHEAEMAASSARFQAELGRQLAAGIGDIAGTVRQVDAANQGKIVAHRRVEVPVVNLAGVPTSTGALGDALVAHVPELLRSVARLHPKQDALFEQSAAALLVVRRQLAPSPAQPSPPPADASLGGTVIDPAEAGTTTP